MIYFALRRWDKDRVKVALQAFFFSLSCTTVPAQVMRGLLSWRHLYFDAIGIPAVLLGIGGGTVVYNKFDLKTFRRVVVGSLLVMGVIWPRSSNSFFWEFE